MKFSKQTFDIWINNNLNIYDFIKKLKNIFNFDKNFKILNPKNLIFINLNNEFEISKLNLIDGIYYF
jgi:hypothetical protein